MFDQQPVPQPGPASVSDHDCPCPRLRIVEVGNDDAFVADILQRKYSAAVPRAPHHVVVRGRAAGGAWRSLAYIYWCEKPQMTLACGAATDGDAVRSMDATTRDELLRRGGALRMGLEYGIARWGRTAPIAATCGNPRALAVIHEVGFVPTAVQHLYMAWPREKTLDEAQRQHLVNAAKSFMPF